VFLIHLAVYASRYKEVQKEEEQIAKDLKQYETKDAITPDGVEIQIVRQHRLDD
jgi:phosphoenolpyruvate-protein kinase (PTS system EI component)